MNSFKKLWNVTEMSVIFSIFSDFISVDILIDTSKGKWETLLVKIFHF